MKKAYYWLAHLLTGCPDYSIHTDWHSCEVRCVGCGRVYKVLKIRLLPLKKR